MSESEQSDAGPGSLLAGITVLVVEDTWPVAQAIKAMLEQLGMHVIGPAATVSAARELVNTQNPMLALVDVNLKRETATSLIDELHQQDIPIVIVSAYEMPPVAMNKTAAFLQKPFLTKELVTTLLPIARRLR